MQIAGNFRTDPLILTAICKLTLKTLEVKKDDCRKLEIIVGNIKQRGCRFPTSKTLGSVNNTYNLAAK